MARKSTIKPKSCSVSKKTKNNSKVLVSGDVIIDHHIYQGTRSAND
jgi:hypothetical protein